jgi:hypothetical protein
VDCALAADLEDGGTGCTPPLPPHVDVETSLRQA